MDLFPAYNILKKIELDNTCKILLPVSDVIKVTKERTAKIIPNAVGLYTVGGKHVFGSLLQRNTTYRLMHHVWLKSADPVSRFCFQSRSFLFSSDSKVSNNTLYGQKYPDTP
ncbi:uncharacterized protein TNCV_2173071 [Trichonephila clavipes]|nr:uncharacterized protein TNCV_2173071 [Trichonephila clavipes]